MGVNNYRYDPFLDVASPVNKTNERASIPASSPYTVRLQEVPLKESPTSLTIRAVNWLSSALAIGAATCTVINGSWFLINDVITIDAEKCLVTNVVSNTLTITRGYSDTAAASHYAGAEVFGPIWAEVAAAPAARQFWPDYSTGADSDDSWNTGLVLFNSADAGKQIAISYKGTGTLVDDRAFGGLEGFGNYIVEGLTVVPISGLQVGVNAGKAVISGAPVTQIDQSPIVLTAKSAQLIVKDKTNVNSKVLPKMSANDLVDANTVGLWFPDGSASVPNAAVGVNGNTLAVANALTKTGTITAVDGWAGGYGAKGDGASGRYSPANFSGIPSGANVLEFNFLIKIGELGADQPILDYGSAAGNQRILFYVSAAGNLIINNHSSNFDTGYIFPANRVLLSTLQYTGAMFKVCVNGDFGFSLSVPMGITQTFLYFLMQLNGAAYSKHELHFVEIRNALRTPAQIATLAQKLLIPCAYKNTDGTATDIRSPLPADTAVLAHVVASSTAPITIIDSSNPSGAMGDFGVGIRVGANSRRNKRKFLGWVAFSGTCTKDFDNPFGTRKLNLQGAWALDGVGTLESPIPNDGANSYLSITQSGKIRLTITTGVNVAGVNKTSGYVGVYAEIADEEMI